MKKDFENGGLRYSKQLTVLSFLFMQAPFSFKRSPGVYFSTFLTLETAKIKVEVSLLRGVP